MTLARQGGVAALALIFILQMVTWAASPWSSASADEEYSLRSYVGASFGDSLDVMPTRYEHQSKLWFHDEAWWALMFDSTDSSARIFELSPDHTWR
ncbi:MAG: hypothetical protein H0T46_32170, partial [Deltaproteobacteria bacterium]|nr:hypothetical protein [Deltaproteobacteria bacterium]